VAQVADERMGLQKIDLRDLLAVLHQSAQIAQAPEAEVNGAAAGMLGGGNGMFARGREQSLQDPQPMGPRWLMSPSAQAPQWAPSKRQRSSR
jgi:hypothetical protein